MLDRADIEAIADAVAERLSPAPWEGLVRIDVVCRLLSVERSWVYEHQAELGAHKLDGALRFDVAAVHAYVARTAVEREPVISAPRSGRRRAHSDPAVQKTAVEFELLPIPKKSW